MVIETAFPQIAQYVRPRARLRAADATLALDVLAQVAVGRRIQHIGQFFWKVFVEPQIERVANLGVQK